MVRITRFITSERLGQTYCVIDNEGEAAVVVAFFTVSNDSIKTTFIPKKAVNKIEREIPGRKHLHTYPAVLIGRLGVNQKYQGKQFFIGQQVINYIKRSEIKHIHSRSKTVQKARLF